MGKRSYVNKSLAPTWWKRAEKYEQEFCEYRGNAFAKLLIARGDQIEAFRLDAIDFHHALLNDLCTVQTEEGAIEWTETYGFMTEDDPDYPLALLLERASALRAIRVLHDSFMEAKAGRIHCLRDSVHLLTVDNQEAKCSLNKIGGLNKNALPQDFLLGLTFAPLFGDSFSPEVLLEKLHWTEIGKASKNRLLSFPWTVIPQNDLKAVDDFQIVLAAQRTICDLINLITSGIRVEMSYTEEQQFEPRYNASTPWQAIGLALMKEICDTTFIPKFCANPNCQKQISGRADKIYCERSACRKWGQRNIGLVRRGSS
jgi:hypothetical protein